MSTVRTLLAPRAEHLPAGVTALIPTDVGPRPLLVRKGSEGHLLPEVVVVVEGPSGVLLISPEQHSHEREGGVRPT